MSMSLEELTEHTEQLRHCLEAHRRSLPDIHPSAAAHKREVIAALDPRVRELEVQCARLAAERTAANHTSSLAAVPARLV